MATGSVAGVWWFSVHGVTWFEPLLLLSVTFVTGLGITLGYHRLFCHRAFIARAPLAAALGILGAMTMQGQISGWVSIHRKHHRYSDRLGDPHSPRARGAGIAGAIRGFFQGHVGWVMSDAYCVYVDYVRDLRRDPVVRWVDRWYWLWVAASWIIPGFIGLAWYGTADWILGRLLRGRPAAHALAAQLHLGGELDRASLWPTALRNTRGQPQQRAGQHSHHERRGAAQQPSRLSMVGKLRALPGRDRPRLLGASRFRGHGLGVKGARACPGPDCSAGRSADDWSLALEYQPIERKGAGEIGVQARLEVMHVIAHHLAPHQRNQIGLLAPQIP